MVDKECYKGQWHEQLTHQDPVHLSNKGFPDALLGEIKAFDIGIFTKTATWACVTGRFTISRPAISSRLETRLRWRGVACLGITTLRGWISTLGIASLWGWIATLRISSLLIHCVVIRLIRCIYLFGSRFDKVSNHLRGYWAIGFFNRYETQERWKSCGKQTSTTKNRNSSNFFQNTTTHYTIHI